MKYYALLHAVCGLAEGYSDTTVRWFNDLDKAMEAKQSSLQSLMDEIHEEIVSTTDGMQDIVITIDDRRSRRRDCQNHRTQNRMA